MYNKSITMKLLLVCLSLCVLSRTINSHPNLSTTTKQTIPPSSSSSSSSASVVGSSTSGNSSSNSLVPKVHAGGSDNQSVNVTDQGKTVGAFLNFTKELLNLTSATFNKNKNSDEPIESEILMVEDDELTPSTEEELANDKHIHDLLRGLLDDDEFGSEEEISSHSNSQSVENDKDESEDLNLDIFHDDEVTEVQEESIKTSVSDKDVVTVTDTTVTVDEEEEEDGGDDQEQAESNNGDIEVEEDIIQLKETTLSDAAGENRTSRAHADDDEQDQMESRSSSGVPMKSPRINHKSSARNKKRSEQVTVAKYNKYVDAVFKRMNAMIRGKRMDPLRVNLFAGSPAQTQHHHQNAQHKNNAQKKNTGKNNNNRNKISKPNNNNNNKRGGAKKNGKNPNKGRNANNRQRGGGRPRMNVDNEHDEEDEQEQNIESSRTGRSENNSTSTGKKGDSKMRPVSMESTGKSSSDKSSSKSSSSSSESKEVKTTGSKKIGNGNRPTRGVLHGLSTLRRAGPVKVIRKGPGVRLVRAKFLLGPVALDILPKKSVVGTTKSSNAAAATATARSLKGMLEIRMKSSGPTRIRKLKVFPPSNVRVEGETNRMKKQGYRKITPVAARRLMSVANQVIKRSDKVRNPSTPTTNKNTNKNKKTNKKNNKRRNNTNINNKRRNANKKNQNRPNNSQ